VAAISLKKRFLFGTVLAIFVYCLTEAVAWTFFLISEGEFFSWSEHRQVRTAIVHGAAHDELPSGYIPIATMESEVIHPYLGFVIDPRESRGYSEFGFKGDTPLFTHPAANSLIIGVFGGSFAVGTVQSGADDIRRQLRRDARFEDTEIIVQAIALGGYKQPQQLLSLSYLLSLGAQFDVVVNLDGFNEVAVAPAEYGGVVNPVYPRGWASRIGNPFDPTNIRLAGGLVMIDDAIVAWARVFSSAPLNFNILANLIWRYRHISMFQQRAELATQLQQRVAQSEEEFDYVRAGPKVDFRSDDEMYREMARIWQRASLQMHHVCRQNGIEYIHFLQPNQYVPDSKRLTRKELEVAYDVNHPYREGVLQGYPLLVEHGTALKELGVGFRDLTGAFSEFEGSLYSDTCCHVTADGYGIIGTMIGDAVRDRIAEADTGSR
jgi:hypothetical protein